MKIKLSIFLTAALMLTSVSCTSTQNSVADVFEDSSNVSVVLEATEDCGQEYIDSFIFIGESTTYHMKSREVLSGGKNTTQIWATESGTLNLDMTTKNAKIIHPSSGRKMTFAEAAAIEKPKYIICTFGLNGAVQNVNKGDVYYKTCYRSLLNSIKSASPQTRIILQSAFPVAENMDMSHYSISAKTLNSYIEKINSWTLELAKDDSYRYLNTAEILTNSDGFLYNKFQCGDGYHLTKEAYNLILQYIRTHKYTQ